MNDRSKLPPSSPSAQPSSPQPSQTSKSGAFRLELDSAISAHTPSVSSGKSAVEAASSRPVSVPPSAATENSLVGSAPEDLHDATRTFAKSIDTITNALFLLIGRFDHALRRIHIVIYLAAAAILAQCYMIYRMERMTAHLAEEQRKTSELHRELTALRSEQTAAAETLHEVAARDNITIVADGSSSTSAKVVITPKPSPSATGSNIAVEIPFKFDALKVQSAAPPTP